MADDPAPLALPMIDGRDLPAAVVLADDRPARVAMGLRKSGSSLLAQLVSALARANGWNPVDLPGTAFDLGYTSEDWIADPRLRRLLWRGNCYLGFRAAPLGLIGDPVFAEARKLLLVRDPRDALVSEWFSNRYSHSVPAGGGGAIPAERARALAASLDAYVVARAPLLDRAAAGYAGLLDDPALLIQRYEDVILAKPAWIRSIAAHFGWAADDETVNAILAWAEVVPAVEDPHAFVRRVRPGDHREKLSPDTIRAVEAGLSAVWRRLGYDLGTPV